MKNEENKKMKFTEAEKQLLIVMGYFKEGENPDKKTLEEFGKRNIGEYLVPWDEAYTTLIRNGLLQKKGNIYSLTDLGDIHRKVVERDNPLWLYEYNMYFARAEKSEAHRLFCEQVYGRNLCQHGIADVKQLTKLLDVLQLSEDNSVLDLGCGNGMITEYLSDISGASFTGIDLSEEAIKQAQKRKKKNLHFQVGNMYLLDFDENSFDAAISIDTLYFVDIQEVITQLLTIVKLHGQMGIFFTQWIDDDTEKEMLLPGNTELAEVLNKYNLEYRTVDFTKEEEEHWQKKVRVLEELKPKFEKEDNLTLYEYRYEEAQYYKEWDSQKRYRYLYHIQV